MSLAENTKTALDSRTLTLGVCEPDVAGKGDRAALASQLGGELRFGGASSASGANFSIHVAKIPTARNI